MYVPVKTPSFIDTLQIYLNYGIKIKNTRWTKVFVKTSIIRHFQWLPVCLKVICDLSFVAGIIYLLLTYLKVLLYVKPMTPEK